jgi:hypothetical protein
VPATDPLGSPSRKRLLVLSYHAPPGQAVGGLRWWGLSRHLARRGWHVRLLTAEAAAADEPCPEGMTVEVISRRLTLATRYNRWAVTRRSARAAPAFREPPDPGPTGVGSGSFRTLRTALSGLLVFPDEGRGWLINAARAVRRNVHEFSPDVVVSTGPPHSVHLAAWAGVWRRGTAWVADFRDPWADEAQLHIRAAWAAPLMYRLEAGVIRSAQRVLTNTTKQMSAFQERYPDITVDCLPNGVDLEGLPSRISPDSRRLTMVHLGTLYHRRDPIPAVRAFALFVRRNPAAAADGSKLLFVGSMGDDYRQRIQTTATEEGIGGLVGLEGVRPRAEALEILATSDISLVLAQDQETAIPAKIYESVGMRIPTLVITEPDSATGEAARRLGAAVHVPSDVEGMAGTMEKVWAGQWDVDLPHGVRVDYAELAEDAEYLLLETLGGS